MSVQARNSSAEDYKIPCRTLNFFGHNILIMYEDKPYTNLDTYLAAFVIAARVSPSSLQKSLIDFDVEKY